MKKTPLLLIAVVGAAALAYAQGTSTVLTTVAKRMSGLMTLDAQLTYTEIGGSAERYSVTLKKPIYARIETADRLIVADGTNLVTYDKKENKWWKETQSTANLLALFSEEPLRFFAGFYDIAPGPVAARDLAPVTRNGKTLKVAAVAGGDKTTTWYVGPQNVVEQATVDQRRGEDKTTQILNVRSLVLDGDVAPDRLRFTPPAGAQEIPLSEVDAAKWVTNLEEAKKLAAKTKKMIFVDFMATWCGPCKDLEREVFGTKEFKDLGKKAVFLKIDVDRQPNVAEAYKVDAMPTQMVLDAKGAIVDTKVGYGKGGKAEFLSWLKEALAK